MANATVEYERKGPFPGYGRFYGCLATLAATETTAVTVPTGLQKVLNVQFSAQTNPGTVGYWATASGGTVTLDASGAISGTNKVWLMAYGT